MCKNFRVGNICGGFNIVLNLIIFYFFNFYFFCCTGHMNLDRGPYSSQRPWVNVLCKRTALCKLQYTDHHLIGTLLLLCVFLSVVCVDMVCGTVLIIPALRLQSVQALWSSPLDLVWGPALVWTRGLAQSPSMAAFVLREPCSWCVSSFISLFKYIHLTRAIMQ